MIKFDKKVDNVDNLNYKLHLAYEESKKDEDFKELVDSIDLSDEELMKHTCLLEDAKEEYKNCKDCKGLLCCKNKITGFCFLPVLNEGKLSFSYVACKYKNKYDSDNEFKKNVTSFDIPKEIKEARIKDIYTDDNNRKEVIKWILQYVKDFTNNKVGKGLYLHGNFGCGKTYLISAMFNELAKKGTKSVIIYWPEYLRSLKACFQSSVDDEFKNRFNEVKYAKLLLIDDLGAETVTSWSRDEVLGTILQYRMQQELPTFITSNLNIKQLEEHLSVTSSNKSERLKAVRIIERIKQLTIDTEMVSKNRR